MHSTLAALALWGSGVAVAQDAPAPETPADEAPSPDLDAEIAAFLGEQPLAAAPPPPPTPVAAPNALNPSITAFGDLLTTVGFDGEGVMPGSGPWLRSFEMDIQAAVDPFARAVAVIALHQEPPELEHHEDEEDAAEEHDAEEEHAHGAAEFEVAPEEVYIDLVALPGGFSARIGQQKLPFGITNRMHPHDWAWPDAPLPFAAVMGEEGLADVAATVSWRLGLPWHHALTLTGSATSGDLFDAEREDPVPGWLGRAEYFAEAGSFDLGLGASSTGQGDSRRDGADAMLRWRGSSWRSVVLMGEAFRAVGHVEDEHDVPTEVEEDHDDEGPGPIGFTSTLQVQPSRPVYIGLRLDQYDGDWQYAAYLSYYTSEFLRLRAGATTDLDAWIANAQLTFVWGSHPVEPYWVNR